MTKQKRDFYNELDEILYEMAISVEFLRIIECEIWEYPFDELKRETKGVLTLAIDNYERLFNRLSNIVKEKIEEK